MKALKQGSFLLVLLLTGMCFMTIDGFRQVAYAEAQNWIAYLQLEESVSTGNADSGSENKTVTGNGNISMTANGETEQAAGSIEENGTEPEAGGQEETTGAGVPEQEEQSTEAVREFTTVDESYFDDALFIGDSRTVGLQEYAGLENSTFYASTGLTVYKMFVSPVVSLDGSKQKITIEEALQNNQFSKIYLMIGINEMGTGTVDTFMETYEAQVRHLQELQPDAVIYLQAIMRVTTERAGKGDYIHNTGIDERNNRIARLADNNRIFYLDVNPLVCDETGGIVPEYTFDGVHLKAEYILKWKQFLMENAVSE